MLGMVLFLIVFPFICAGVLALMRKSGPYRKYTLFTFCAIIAAVDIYFIISSLVMDQTQEYLVETHLLDNLMLLAEWALLILISYFSIKHRKYYCMILSILQTGLITYLEVTGQTESHIAHLYVDKLTLVMCLIVGLIGCLICVYAMGYMKDFKAHHAEFKDRRSFFFSMLFVFMGAMFGLIFSNNMIWMYFFWEITSVCSFLLIGYNQSKEAVNNSFRAL